MIKMEEPMNSHRELFNKLVASQSQPIIMSASSLGEQPDYHKQASIDGVMRCSSAIEPSTNELDKRPNKQPLQQPHQRRCSSLSGPSSSSSSSSSGERQHQQLLEQRRNVCDLLPEDFKKAPVVFSSFRNRWYTNEEVASILTNFNSHAEWQTNELQVRPKSGAVYLYSREKVRYRQDGYCWKKRKNGRTTREDHMKLKVQGIECIYGCYVHSAILPTFHRRCYWLLQNPDIVLVHYLNQPAEDQNKMMITFNSSSLEAFTRRSWTNEEIIEEVGSVFGGISQIKHMLNINIPPDGNALFHQEQQVQQQVAALEQHQLQQDQPLVDHQYLDQQHQTQSNEPLYLPANNQHHDGSAITNQTCYVTSIVTSAADAAAADETAHQVSSPFSMDLLVPSDPFGATVAQFQSDSANHQLREQPQQQQQYQTQCQQQIDIKPQLDGLQQHQQQLADQHYMTLDDRGHTTTLTSNDEVDNILMGDFNLQASSLGQVDEELVSNVIESLSNVEDLRDLLSGIPNSTDQQVAEDTTAIMSQLDNDSPEEQSVDLMSCTTETTTTGVSSFDLYNNCCYKPDLSSRQCSPYFDHHYSQQQEQFDARSSLSDETDSLLMRPSPSAPVSRSNSIGNNVNSYSCNMSHISWSSYDSGTS